MQKKTTKCWDLLSKIRRGQKMTINRICGNLERAIPISYMNIRRNGTREIVSSEILNEHVIDVYVNECLTMKLVCTPEYLVELVVGRMLTEGMITSSKDILKIYICESGRRAKVFLTSELKESDSYVETTQTCCTGNHIFHDYFMTSKEPNQLKNVFWKKDWIFSIADEFARDTELHKNTWSTHSCFLAKKDSILFRCEDIGRHNAMDKAIGYSLLNRIDLSECILYSSGRIPADMTIKAIRAGVPLLVSKAQASVQAVALAKDYGLTLIAGARPDSMRLLSGTVPEKKEMHSM